MSAFVLDTSAVVAWVIQEQPRWKAVDALITNVASEPVLPGPALTEAVAVARRRGNNSSGAQLLLAFQASGIRLEHAQTADLLRAAELVEAAATHRTGPGRAHTLSFCDSLILAISERLGLPVITGDSHWQQLATDGITQAEVVLL